MRTFDAIEKMAAEAGMSVRCLSRTAGRSDTFLSMLKSRGSDSKAGTVADFARACGYRLCLVPERDVPESAIVVDPSDQ